MRVYRRTDAGPLARVLLCRAYRPCQAIINGERLYERMSEMTFDVDTNATATGIYTIDDAEGISHAACQ